MSSISSCGKRATISSAFIPEARYSSTSPTVMRVFRMQGLPLLRSGSITILPLKDVPRPSSKP